MLREVTWLVLGLELGLEPKAASPEVRPKLRLESKATWPIVGLEPVPKSEVAWQPEHVLEPKAA